MVRAHMNIAGYGGAAMGGSVQEGFTHRELPVDFGKEVEMQEPQPVNCDF